jgi:hypothetical protein
MTTVVQLAVDEMRWIGTMMAASLRELKASTAPPTAERDALMRDLRRWMASIGVNDDGTPIDNAIPRN